MGRDGPRCHPMDPRSHHKDPKSHLKVLGFILGVVVVLGVILGVQGLDKMIDSRALMVFLAKRFRSISRKRVRGEPRKHTCSVNGIYSKREALQQQHVFSANIMIVREMRWMNL